MIQLNLTNKSYGFMKLLSKNVLSGFHVNPIHRDLVLVISVGFVIAISIVTLLVMIISQI